MMLKNTLYGFRSVPRVDLAQRLRAEQSRAQAQAALDNYESLSHGGFKRRRLGSNDRAAVDWDGCDTDDGPIPLDELIK